LDSRTTPLVALDDRTYWRRLLATVHPDRDHGDHELFVFLTALRKHVEGCAGELRIESKPSPSRASEARPSYTPPDDKPRIPYPTAAAFAEVTRTALLLAANNNAYGEVLSLLVDCYPLEHLAYEQDRGASYKRLAAIAHTWGMSKAERTGWYRACESIPLSDRHAGHILSKLKRQAA
jgi:hypothetical protein